MGLFSAVMTEEAMAWCSGRCPCWRWNRTVATAAADAASCAMSLGLPPGSMRTKALRVSCALWRYLSAS